MSFRFRATRVPFGALLAAIVLVALPHLLIARLAGGAPYGRIPLLGQAVFDTYAYMQWIGATMAEWPEPPLFSWFTGIVSLIGRIPHVAPAEVWVISATLAMMLLFWILWSIIRQQHPPREAFIWVAIFTAFPILSLALRPGAYSWYLPFAVGAYAAMWPLHRALSRAAWPTAMVWSIGIVAAAALYPWYALFAGIWLIALWADILFSREPIRVAVSVWVFASMALVTGSLLLAPQFALSVWKASADFYTRTGIEWSHLPVITNVLLATLLIALFSWFVAWACAGDKRFRSQFWVLSVGWIAFFASWFHSLITGLYTSNDHFRAPALILAWASVFILYRSIQEGVAFHETAKKRWIKNLFIGVIFFSALQVIMRLSSHLVDDLLQQSHIALWILTALVAAFAYAIQQGIRPHRNLFVFCVYAWLLLGVWSYGTTLAREARVTHALRPMTPLLSWMDETLPAQQVGCADPELADVLSAQSGQRIYPAETTAYRIETHEALAERFQVLLSRFSPSTDASWEKWRASWQGYRGATCRQFGVAVNTLRTLGLSEDAILSLSGCAAEQIQYDWEQIINQAHFSTIPESRFRTMCPIVYMHTDMQGVWTLPSEYVERTFLPFTVWIDPTVLLME